MDVGVCPYPGQQQLAVYVDSLKTVLNHTRCSTVDWVNMEAQKDCGVGGYNEGELYSAWQKAVESQFNITYWQYIQTNETRECMEQVMATSLTNLEKKNGYRLVVEMGLIASAFIIAFGQGIIF